MSSPVPSFSDDDESCTHALQLVFVSTLPTALRTAIELDVFETVAKAGPGACLSAAQISAGLPKRHADTAARMDRMLALLASYDVLTCSVEADADGKAVRKYGAAPVAKFFAKNENGASLAPMALLASSKYAAEPRYYLKDAIMDGEVPSHKARGMSPYEFQFHTKEPLMSKTFNEAMMSYSAIVVKGILEAYKGFDDANVVADVGGGLGATLHEIVKKHPRIKGINFDLPHVISKAPKIPGVEHIAGDMFESVPAGADVILMKEVLHNWGDDECVKILKNCWEALGDFDHGKVVVVERCLPELPENGREAQCVFQMDLIMMAVHPGKERTKEEFESMAKKAGFSGIQATCSYATHSVLEFYK